MSARSWYDSLAKPGWTPSPDVIGMIWNILYPIILLVNVYVIYKVSIGELPKNLLWPLLLNLLFNILFTPIQFGLQNLWLASIDIILVWATIVWAIIALWPQVKWGSLAFIPYLIWVSVAGYLQLSITFMNK